MQTENNKATEKVESTVSEETRQETETQAQQKWLWVEAAVWTVRMLAALVNGVKGGKWFSLMDKIYAERTLQIAWQRVRRNRGAAGIDRTISNGQMPTSRAWDFSRWLKPIRKRADPDEETIDGRAVCGRTARTVRREGRVWNGLFSTL